MEGRNRQIQELCRPVSAVGTQVRTLKAIEARIAFFSGLWSESAQNARGIVPSGARGDTSPALR